MLDNQHFWMRAETRPDEQRAPITPEDAARLIGAGHRVSVEACRNRVLHDDRYRAAGCQIVQAGSWLHAPLNAWILGLKELPDQTGPLRHRHIYFAHAIKGQTGAADLLQCFADGGGALFDLEYMADAQGRRIAAFGYWAGYVGASLGLLAWNGDLGSLAAMTQSVLRARLSSMDLVRRPRTLVIGANGRCGQGARDALADAGLTPTAWDIAETRALDRADLLDHDMLVNAVGMTGPADPFVTPACIAEPKRRLTMIVDVTCDVYGPAHCLPVYDSLTSWTRPVRHLNTPADTPLSVIAIDNLPSLLPAESSADFSVQLTPHLMTAGRSTPWHSAQKAFETAAVAAAIQPHMQKELTHA